MQTALEAEVTEFLGRDRYVRAERARAGSRNGHCATTIKTTSGPVTIERPKLRDTDEAFASRLLGTGVCRTNALESLVIASFVRGLSVRDVEATLAEALGSEAALSKSTVSRVCEAIKIEFEAWRTRDLSGVTLDYLFLDGSHFKFHAGAPAEPVLCAWGITTEGAPVFIGLAPGASESHDAWAGFLADLTSSNRRARSPRKSTMSTRRSNPSQQSRSLTNEEPPPASFYTVSGTPPCSTPLTGFEPEWTSRTGDKVHTDTDQWTEIRKKLLIEAHRSAPSADRLGDRAPGLGQDPCQSRVPRYQRPASSRCSGLTFA